MPGIGEVIEHAHVLTQHEHAGRLGIRDADVLPGAARRSARGRSSRRACTRRTRGRARPAAPSRPAARACRVRLELDDDGAGAVGQHPPQEVGVHAGADAVVAPLPQAAARQLRADDGGARMVTEADLADGGIERRQARRAHARRATAAASVRRRGVRAPSTRSPGTSTSPIVVAHASMRRSDASIPRSSSAALERLDGELLVELGRLTVLIERVVPLPDAVGLEDAAADARGDGVVAAEPGRDAVVVDRITGEVRAEAGEVRGRRRAHGDDTRARGVCVCAAAFAQLLNSMFGCHFSTISASVSMTCRARSHSSIR